MTLSEKRLSDLTVPDATPRRQHALVKRFARQGVDEPDPGADELRLEQMRLDRLLDDRSAGSLHPDP